jgi:small subunit ribosomal protein S1
MEKYYPEGIIYESKSNKKAMESLTNLHDYFFEEKILEAKATLCDKEHNLYVDLGIMKGLMPREECALGIAEGTVRDIAIISRVNRPVAFKIIDFKEDADGNKLAILSRRLVQEKCMKDYIKRLSVGDVIDARVTHNEAFGTFCDIGCGISALLPIDGISVSRIPHPDVRFKVNTMIKAVVKSIDDEGKVTLSHKELLGTWEENAESFKAGQTVSGVVRSIEKYGIFIELAPNLAGLAEYTPDVSVGDATSVYIKSINPEKMKIKLAIVDSFPADEHVPKITYFYHENHIDYWRYSPENSQKIIDSNFMVEKEEKM